MEVLKFVQIVEKETGRKADIRYANVSTEIPTTYADTEKARIVLGWQAQTHIGLGMAKFIQWFRGPDRAADFSNGLHNGVPAAADGPASEGFSKGEHEERRLRRGHRRSHLQSQ